MTKITRALLIVKVFVWSLSALTVLAADRVALLPDTIPLAQYLYALALSSMGGITSMLQRFARADEKGKVWLLVARDVVCSVAAGFIAFYALTHFEIAPMLAAIGVFLSGYGGSRFLEAVYTRFENRVGKAIDTVGAGKNAGGSE
jgi:CHASE2 domain-containing sensor protein